MSFYRASRVEGPILGSGATPCQYIDVIDVDDIDRYRALLANPSGPLGDLIDQVEDWVGDSVGLYGSVIEKS